MNKAKVVDTSTVDIIARQVSEKSIGSADSGICQSVSEMASLTLTDEERSTTTKPNTKVFKVTLIRGELWTADGYCSFVPIKQDQGHGNGGIGDEKFPNLSGGIREINNRGAGDAEHGSGLEPERRLLLIDGVEQPFIPTTLHDCEHGQHAAMTGDHQPSGKPFVERSCWSSRSYGYPMLYLSTNGTISVLLRHDVMVEMTVDRTVRVLCAGKFSAASNQRANASCIMHPVARVYQEDVKVFSSFKDEKQAVIGAQGVVFTMKGLSHAYLVSSDKIHGTLPFPRNSVRFPELPRDASLSLFYSSQYGEKFYDQCFDIVRNAKYQTQGDTIIVHINAIHIRQSGDGEVEVSARPRFVNLNPLKGTLSVRTHFVHMGVQEGGKAFIKRGVKRVHVSPSGLVVSDGNHTTSMDFFGRIVAST